MAYTRGLSRLFLLYLFVARLAYMSYLHVAVGKSKLTATILSEVPQHDNRPFSNKLIFRSKASTIQSRWYKHGYVCLSPTVAHKDVELTIFMDVDPNPGPPNCLNCLYLNARSLKAFVPSSVDPSVKVCKISLLQDLVYSGMYDLVSICETWLNDNVFTSEILPGYSVFRRDRPFKTGGGVVIAIKSDLQAIRRSDLERDNTEMVAVEILTSTKPLILYTFYRPPDSNNDDLLQLNYSLRSNSESSCMLVVGDFNIPALDWSDSSSPVNIGGNAAGDKICDLMGDNFLFQFIDGPTHIAGNKLDLLLCNCPEVIEDVIT